MTLFRWDSSFGRCALRWLCVSLLGLISVPLLADDSCDIEVSQRVGSLFSASSYTFAEITQITGVTESLVSGSRLLCLLPSRRPRGFSVIPPNRIDTRRRCVFDFTVSGPDVDCDAEPESAGVSIATSPLNVTVAKPPNILMILDNSNSMAEGLDGGVAATCQPGPAADCVAGAASPVSKSEYIRGVGRGLIETYMGRVNMGLMAYQQNPIRSSGWSADIFSNNVVRGDIFDRIYDVSYDPANYDPEFSGSPWDDSRKQFLIENPEDPSNYIYFNVRVPGYGEVGSGQTGFYHFRAGTDWTQEPFQFDCFRRKTGSSDARTSYFNRCGRTSGFLNDSARARGVTNWGQRMVRFPYNATEWISSQSPGLGYLHTPMRPLDEEQRDRLAKKLAPQHQDYSASLLTDPEEPIIAAGLTPLEGTLLTARDYFVNGSQYFGDDQGRGNAEYPLPNSCEVNAAVWLTDGMPSVDRFGNALGEDVEQALSDAVAATTQLHQDANADVYVVGFAMPPTVSEDQLEQLAFAGGTSRAYLANRPEELDDALNRIFDNIISSAREVGTAAAVSTAFVQEDSKAFLAGYRSLDWSGELVAYTLDDDAQYAELVWDAEQQFRSRNLNTRRIFTTKRDAGGTLGNVIRLNPTNADNLHADQRDALNRNFSGNTDGLLLPRLAWLFGLENGALRSRDDPQDGLRVLGDVVHSTPQFVGTRGPIYRQLPGEEGSRHVEFRTDENSIIRNRPDMLYLGSNSGKLHAFDADTGNELFAYIPSELLAPGLNDRAPITELMEQDYSHRYFVDGEPTVGDAYWNGSWKNVLVGTMGAGGRTVFALDVSDPTSFSEDNVLWEFTHEELGYGVSQPQIVRLASGDWAAVFGNGYNGASHRATLFVVRISDGQLLARIDTSEGGGASPNGLAAPALTAWPSQSGVASRAYAGDLHGNLWRFDLSDSVPGNWSADAALFQATDPSGSAQPITSRPALAPHPRNESKVIVLFGAGSYFRDEDGDLTDPQTQSLYGVFDSIDGDSGITRSNLLRQEITWEGSVTVPLDGGGTETYRGREVSNNPIGPSHAGWRLDLDSGGATGERVVASPNITGQRTLRVRFSTMVPSDDPCNPGRTGRIANLDVYSGASGSDAVFDLNRDRNLDSGDKPSGRNLVMIEVGDGTRTATIGSGDGLFNQFLLNCNPSVENCDIAAAEDRDAVPVGRQSWEQPR